MVNRVLFVRFSPCFFFFSSKKELEVDSDVFGNFRVHAAEQQVCHIL